MRRIIVLVFTFLCSATTHAQVGLSQRVAGFEYSETIKGKDNGNLPLLIAFHYSSGTPVETLADYDSLKKPVRIIIPKGNYNKREGFSYYPVDYYERDSLTQFSLARKTVDSIAQFVALIEKKHKQKAVVSGISQGGDIAFMLAVYYPQLCRASFPFAAVIHPNIIHELALKPVNKVPIFLFQGESDEIVHVAATRKKVSEIGDRLKLKLYTYPNLGHGISKKMMIEYSALIDKINN